MIETIALGALGIAALWAALGVRVVNQVERGIVFRFGRAQPHPRPPGVAFLIPVVDRMKKVNVQIVTMPVPGQEGITRDNVSVKVDAVVYFRVENPITAAVEVQNYKFAVGQVAQTSLRSIIGKSELDDLLSNREQLNRGLELMLDSPALGWGIHIDRIEIKDVQLPESMKRSIARQAEAERERRARVITADGEFQAAQKLADASEIMTKTEGALQLRLLQTVVEVAAEKNSTLVMPFPVEMLRFFERTAESVRVRSKAAPEADNTPAEVASAPAEVASAPAEVASAPAEVASAPAEVAGAPDEPPALPAAPPEDASPATPNNARTHA